MKSLTLIICVLSVDDWSEVLKRQNLPVHDSQKTSVCQSSPHPEGVGFLRDVSPIFGRPTIV